MTSVVISQPMYFPWPGLLEQFRLCDAFVYYDDVQFTRGFFNRVQIKTAQGVRWLTVPLVKWQRGQLVNDVRIDHAKDWKRRQRNQLLHAYAGAPFRKDLLNLVDEVFAYDYQFIGDLAQASTDALIRFFPSIAKDTRILKSSSMNIPGAATQRLIDLCGELHADTYLTGHGARNYLEHERFEARSIHVAYIDYGLSEYAQVNGPFTPYVSTLDLIANCGPKGVEHIRGRMLPWRVFVARMSQAKNES